MESLTMSRCMRVVLAGLCLGAGLGARPASAACPATLADLTRHVEEAEDAFAAIEATAFETAVAAMRSDLSCLVSTPDPRLASSVHGVEALDAYLDQDQGRALLSLRAMVETWPGADLSVDLAPEGGELRAWLTMASRVPPAPRAPVSIPAGHDLVVDGLSARDVPTDRPAVVALVGPYGDLVWSGVFTGPAALPGLGAAEQFAGDAEEEKPRLRRPLLLAAGGLALASAGLWAGALYESRQIGLIGESIAAGQADVGVGDGDSLDALVARTNALGLAGQVTGGLALGGCVVGLVVRW